jgi:hypothetical protein
MELSTEDQGFLRDLVKTSRQRTHHVKWVDRDGTARLSALNQVEIVRLNHLAGRFKIAGGEMLRRAAHIPVSTPPAG